MVADGKGRGTMPPNEDLSPEEKLLRVIQGNPASNDVSASSPTSEAPEEAVLAEDVSSVDGGDAHQPAPDMGGPAGGAESAGADDAPVDAPAETVAPVKEDVALPEIKLDDEPPLTGEALEEDVSVPVEMPDDTETEVVEEENPPLTPSGSGSEGAKDELEPAAEEERPKLQLARKSESEPENADDLLDVPVEDETHVETTADTEAVLPVVETASNEDEEESTVAVPIVVAKKRKEDDASIRKVNRLLLIAAMLVLALIGFQIWANVREKSAPSPVPGDILLPDDVDMAELPPIDDIQQLFVDKPWFLDQTEPLPDPDKGSKVDDFEKFVRENIKLVGVSKVSDGKYESIIVDKKIDKMHFLQTGDRMLTGAEGNKKELTVVKISSESATVSDGRKNYELTGK